MPQERVCSALDVIYRHNCLGIKGGKFGAINGAMPSGGKDISSVQSEEHWVGVNYTTAATMIREVCWAPFRSGGAAGSFPRCFSCRA